MQFSTFNLSKLCAIAAVAWLTTACGGGDGDDDGGNATFATSTGARTNGVVGKAIYTTSCNGCHGASVSAGVNYSRILNAIAANKGGMGYLTASINTSTADDIATYLAFGAVLPQQTITFTSPGNQTIGVATPALLATSDSGLAVTLASSTPSVCTVTGTALTLVATGSCTVTASQAGSTAFAATASNTFTVAPAATVGVSATGKTLYTAACAMCHGATPATLLTRNILKAANTPSVISSAISTGFTSGPPSVATNMGFLSANAYTPQQLADIAAYLATPGF